MCQSRGPFDSSRLLIALQFVHALDSIAKPPSPPAELEGLAGIRFRMAGSGSGLQVRSRGSKVNGAGLLIVIFLKSGWAGLST